MSPLRVVVTGGGTGGHLYPALAVVEALQQDPDVEDILYIGNRHKKEAELVPGYGIRFQGLMFSGMPRKMGLGLITWGIQFVQAFIEARGMLAAFRPSVAFGTGGYVTAPVLLAARSLGVPYVIHEPDAHPGMVNRNLFRQAAGVTCAFEAARAVLKNSHLKVTGNPLRAGMGHVSRENALKALQLDFDLDKPVLLVTGGSQGARKINQAVVNALPRLIDELGFQVIHQTGEQLYEEVLAACPDVYRNHPAYRVQAFIRDMASTLALATVAVCRSGSMTLSEMYQGHIPTILVPYPYAAADHQRKNALASQEAGASIMIEDADLTGETLVTSLSALMARPEQLMAMKEAARALSTPQATANVVAVIKEAAQRT